jgi:hypothetical protein
MGLDESQYRALHRILSKRIAIVQGKWRDTINTMYLYDVRQHLSES